jgi:hypothetical protein
MSVSSLSLFDKHLFSIHDIHALRQLADGGWRGCRGYPHAAQRVHVGSAALGIYGYLYGIDVGWVQVLVVAYRQRAVSRMGLTVVEVEVGSEGFEG